MNGKDITVLPDKDLDLAQICDSGQCFRMKRLDEPGTFEIIAVSERLVAKQCRDCVELQCDKDTYEAFWRSYFDMDTDYSAIKASVDPDDPFLSHAVSVGSGLRILRQDPWEMTVTFLISQQNNIPRIHRCIDNICREYGEHDPLGFYAFPTPDRLSGLNEDDLMPCNLGYRSKYVVRAAGAVADGSLDLDAIGRMDYPAAREALLKVYGIGAKVADCICLFGLHHLEAFPVDTHIRQVLEREYPDGFDYDRYRDHLGVIQQYMFYNEIG